ncbi:hypothetical protein C0V70_02055 [Bacteriovorax stolpii]|uniref:histidine kinase n=1 Tax=Bacteriovorax stolpii TaxID=960 RepID=A0A2K9NN23_BACTC|nr:HAMP domain-containing sensor histidine kinase [Bacteriovorax stolpii]AUN96907.1 hypothetical protein C0V70_02055 [Bacteriovorax stolpii]TDP53187.1 phospho-acceptor domain-containing protein [Bacteriovorax stolpii]
MYQEKKQYIEDQLSNDYVVKAQNSSIAFLLGALLYFFLHREHDKYQVYIIILLVGIVILSILRLYNANRYINKKVPLQDAVKIASFSAIFNGLLWSAVGIFSILSFDTVSVQIIITFIILISFSAGSLLTLSHRWPVLMIFNFSILCPQVFYAFYHRSGDGGSLWLLAYTAVNILYIFRQANVVQSELKMRFISEYDLKESLEAIALSKKTLEVESIKTFHASRLSSLGEMAGGVAHEINNPLTIIQGITKSIMVHDQLKIDDQTREKLGKIHAASQRIAKIVKGMKTISSKHDQIEHEELKVSKALELSLGLFEERLKNESVTFRYENSTDPTIRCNPQQISQIIINLLSNALDALLKNDSQSHNLDVLVIEDKANQAVDIRVINSGPLIDSEIETKIFEPFFSTKSLGKGTGLGLSISQTLAGNNGGYLSYEVYQGKVCFKLRLPTVTA